MSKLEVMEGLKEILSAIRPDSVLDAITMESRLVEDLAIDSLMMFLLSLAIEKKFDVTIDEKQIFKTVDDVCSYIVTLK